MSFNRQTIYADMLAHLIKMASIGIREWQKYAWSRAKELAADKSGLFAGIDQDLAQAMTGGQAKAGESGHPTPTKPL